MRALAFLFLVSAAADWPAWLLDRAGVAALGFACLALALPAKPRQPMRRLFPSPPASPPAGADNGTPIPNARLEQIVAASRLETPEG